MKDFLISYGLLIIEIIIGLISFIVLCLKKNKIILEDTAFEKLISKLPSIISKAELLSADGQIKKSYVLGVAYSFLADLTGKSSEQIAEEYCERISCAVESILETPQKKGVIVYDDKEKKN